MTTIIKVFNLLIQTLSHPKRLYVKLFDYYYHTAFNVLTAINELN